MNDATKSRLRYRAALTYGLAGIPIIFLLVMLVRLSVNVPFWDQWDLVAKIENLRQGKLLVSDFWEQHNEHRLFFPRIVMLGLAVITNWDTRYEVASSVVFAVASFGLLLLICRESFRLTKQSLPMVLPLLLAMVWFSPVQSENWLWGWQLQWFLSVLAVMCGIHGISRMASRKFSAIDFACVAAAGIVAQYSLGNGLLIWPLVLIAMAFTGVARIYLAGTFSIAVMTTGLHLVTQRAFEPVASRSYFLSHPLVFMEYFFTYLGRPLYSHGWLTTVCGVVLFLGFVGGVLWLFIRHRQRFIAALPWTALGLYAIGSALLTSIGRAGLGLETAYASRYTTISSLLLVSVIVLVAQQRDLITLPAGSRRVAAGALLSGLLFLIIVNVQYGIAWAEKQSQYLKDIKNCTSQQLPEDICLRSTHPVKESVAPKLEYLKSIHWGGY